MPKVNKTAVVENRIPSLRATSNEMKALGRVNSNIVHHNHRKIPTATAVPIIALSFMCCEDPKRLATRSHSTGTEAKLFHGLIASENGVSRKTVT